MLNIIGTKKVIENDTRVKTSSKFCPIARSMPLAIIIAIPAINNVFPRYLFALYHISSLENVFFVLNP